VLPEYRQSHNYSVKKQSLYNLTFRNCLEWTDFDFSIVFFNNANICPFHEQDTLTLVEFFLVCSKLQHSVQSGLPVS